MADRFDEMAREALLKRRKELGPYGLMRGEEDDVANIAAALRTAHAAGKAEGCDKSTIPEGYMLVPIVLPPGIVTQATPAVELRDKPGNMVERVYRSILSALQAKGY